MIEACLVTVHHVQPKCENDLEIDLTCANKDSLITWHEAGHITLSEAVLPGSVQLASSRRRSKRSAGFVQGSLSAEQDRVKRREMDAVVSLAGKAATEMRFGVAGDGVREDLNAAYRTVRDLFEDEYYGGFGFCSPSHYSASEARQQAIEAATDSKLCEFERIAQTCLQRNRGFLEAVADELAKPRRPACRRHRAHQSRPPRGAAGSVAYRGHVAPETQEAPPGFPGGASFASLCHAKRIFAQSVRSRTTQLQQATITLR